MILDGYDWFRAFHILSVIAWMAGLLYLPRLFVYHCDAEPDGELDKALKLQESRLLNVIMNPAMVLAWVFGLLLIWANAERANSWVIFTEWAWVSKFILVSCMTLVHWILSKRQKLFAVGLNNWSHKRYRLINEVPFVFAIIIVLIAVVVLR
jgi:putative membrane protein